MNKQLIEKLLKAFLSNDPIRPGMHHVIPTEWNGKRWIGATDGYRIALIPSDEKSPSVENAPNLASVMFDENQCIEIDLPDLKRCVIEAEKALNGLPKTERCEDCYGAGEFTHGNHDYDCLNCEGTGDVFLENECLIDFNGRKIDYKFIKDLYVITIESGAKSLYCVGVKSHMVLMRADNGILVLICCIGESADLEEMQIIESKIKFEINPKLDKSRKYDPDHKPI